METETTPPAEPTQPAEPTKPAQPAQTAAEGPPPEALAELMIALSARWQTDAGKIAIGVPRGRLLAAAGTDEKGLTALLEALQKEIGRLGLELVDYYYEREHWFCLKSQYAAPNELGLAEQGVLGSLIGLLESQEKAERAALPVADLRKKLIGGKYISRYQLDAALSKLITLGFVTRKRSSLSYGPRTLIELSSERRSNIAEEAEALIF